MRRPPLPKHRKVLGELAETKFMSEAMRRGFRVCKPYGNSGAFDFILEKRGRMLRIQVKSTAHQRGRRERHYQINTGVGRPGRGGRRHYRRWEADFIVAYVFPLGTWYIIPIRAVQVTHMHVRPWVGRGRFEKYLEAWHLLSGPALRRRGTRRRAA